MNKMKIEELLNNNTIEINNEIVLDLSNNNYLNINFILKENSILHIIDISDSINNKEYNFTLADNSYLEINKFYKVKNIDEIINIDLNGINSEVKYNFSTILDTNQDYKISINHNNKSTKSHIINHGVVLNNSMLSIEVNGTVKRGCTNSILDQSSKIITLGENNSIIRPNLYIDEYSVEAKHGASIGRFNKDQLFYLNSRGIDELESNRLLTKGFLFNHLNIENINDIKF